MENYGQQQQFSNFRSSGTTYHIPAGAISKKFMSGVFLWMFIALGVSALTSFLFASTPALAESLYTTTDRGARLSGLGTIITIAPLAFVMIMSFGLNRLSPGALTGIFVAYATVMGMSLSTLALTYTASSLLGCFASASVMFGIMAVMGYTTDKDLTSFGSFMIMGLVGIIIAMMINFFLHSEALGYFISLVGVAVFLGLTAWDVQKLKRIGAGLEYQGISAGDTRKLTIIGALNLYLDFVNIFLFLLRLFGDRRK